VLSTLRRRLPPCTQLHRANKRRGIFHVLKSGQQDIATVDAAIFKIKRSFAEHEAETGKTEWAPRLLTVVKGLNAVGLPHLLGSSPEDVLKSKPLQFELLRQAADDLQDNTEQMWKRADKLEREGGFRTLVARKKIGRRVFNPTWGDKVHTVDRVEGPLVFDTEGEAFPTKEVLAVPADTGQADWEEGRLRRRGQQAARDPAEVR